MKNIVKEMSFFVDNSNINAICLNKSKSHLDRKGTYHLANNFRKYVFNIEWNIYDSVNREKSLECICTSTMFKATDNNSKTASRLNCSKNLNINCIWNNFDSARVPLLNYVNIFIAAETNINESFLLLSLQLMDLIKLWG